MPPHAEVYPGRRASLLGHPRKPLHHAGGCTTTAPASGAARGWAAPGAQQERAQRIVAAPADLLEPSSITGERDFTGGQSKQRSTQREGGPGIKKQAARSLNITD